MKSLSLPKLPTGFKSFKDLYAEIIRLQDIEKVLEREGPVDDIIFQQTYIQDTGQLVTEVIAYKVTEVKRLAFLRK